jgi:hypothetical protein
VVPGYLARRLFADHAHTPSLGSAPETIIWSKQYSECALIPAIALLVEFRPRDPRAAWAFPGSASNSDAYTPENVLLSSALKRFSFDLVHRNDWVGQAWYDAQRKRVPFLFGLGLLAVPPVLVRDLEGPEEYFDAGSFFAELRKRHFSIEIETDVREEF